MEAEYPEQGLLAPWTDPASNTYGDIPLDESNPDLLASDSPTQSPSHHHQRHHHHHPHHHHSHLHQQQQQQQQQHHQPQQQLHHTSHIHQQRQHLPELKLEASPAVAYVTQSHTPYTDIPNAEALAGYEYANSIVPRLIPQHPSEMRTGPGGGGGRVEGGGTGRRGWKRKVEDADETRQPKMDVNQRCDVCGEQASGHYFGALVCLPCKSFFIRCTKDGKPNFSSQCGGKCDILKGGRVRCQHCRFQKCINAGMFRKEKPEAVEPAEGQLLCKVCGDIANGVHFGVTTCEGCKKFFRRGLKENRTYSCKGNMHCSINPRMRNNCRYCRYQKCLIEGMSREAIKMGRPKKGELNYRKPLKYTKMKLGMKSPFDKQMSESNRSSLSSEYEQDEMSAPEDVFDSVSSGQHQRPHPNHQMNNHMQQQQQQPQQSGSFSLGSILHECMTVQDWDQKEDMGSLEQSALRVVSSLSSGNNEKSHESKISQHTRLSSPTLHADVLNRQIQKQHEEQQHLLSQHHHLQMQYVKVLDPVQDNLQQRHQGLIYQVHNPGIEVITDAFASEHSLPVNAAIKVENVSLHDGPDSEYTENIVIEDMRNLDSVNKSEFQDYQLQGLDPNPIYSVCHQQAGSSTSSDGTTLVSISHLNPNMSSQIISINVAPQNVVYAPDNQHDPIIIHSLSQLQQTIDLTQSQDLGQNDLEHKSAQSVPISDYDQDIKVNNMLSSNRNHQIHISQGVIRDSNSLHNDMVLNPHVQNIYEIPHNVFTQPGNSMQQQFSTEITNVSSLDSSIPLSSEPSLSPRRFHSSVGMGKFAASSTALHTNTSSPASFTASQNVINVQHKISGIRSPIAAILQQHREAIQAGRPIQLTPEEVEELLSTVNAEQQLSHQLVDEQVVSKEHRSVSEQNNVDGPREPAVSFVMNTSQQPPFDRHSLYNRQTPPESARNYHNSNPNQSVNHIYRKQYTSGTSSVSHAGLNDRQDLNASYSISNTNSQVSQYISPNHIQSARDSQNSQQSDLYDDSFNSSLIRDSTLLHEINRIFLGIDNSCDSYGCDRQENGAEEGSRVDDEVIVSLMIPDEFSPEVSHKYWHGFKPSKQLVAMTSEQQKIIQDVLDAFSSLQKTYMTNEPEYANRRVSQDQIEHWHHIQRKIARHVVAGQRFCRNIPGYFKLDIQDRISLGKNVGFGLMVLIACTEFYDPEFKRFKYIWNWTMPMQNPLFSYKLHLLSLGDKMHDIQVDRTEASMMCAISMTSIDCPGLLKPKIVCDIRDALIDALQAHISTKEESSQRLQKLMSLMPQVRLMTVWYNNLMKKMSLPSDVVNNKMNTARLVEAVGSENNSSFN